MEIVPTGLAAIPTPLKRLLQGQELRSDYPLFRQYTVAQLAQLPAQMGLTRAYYSGFSPIEQTPFENVAAIHPVREQRLYQASFLLRDYRWNVEDLAFLADGNMDLEQDPKRAWAERYLRAAPLELMTARREQLLRIPGIGPVGADAILKARRQGKLTTLTDLGKLGICAPEQASPYILLNGKCPIAQLSLF